MLYFKKGGIKMPHIDISMFSGRTEEKKKEVAEVSKGALLVVVAAFIIINGFIFKF